MNAPLRIAVPELDEADRIAARFNGYDNQPLYSDDEWRDAAQYFTDTRDDSELLFMRDRQQAFDRFISWQREGECISHREAERREFTDFGNWLDGTCRAVKGAM